LDNLEFDMLSGSEASSLEDPFEEREVWEVIKGMDGDKAPGNGFLSGVLGGDQGGLYGGLCRIP
jgi:tetrahydromethanopterin S-methyltransferase subunit D